MLSDYFNNKESYVFSDSSKPDIINTYIYKYLELERVKDFIRYSEMNFSRICKWEDVYENWFLKATIIIDNQEISYANLQDYFFGMSWSFVGVSDALWRIYSPNKTSVRIRAKVGNVLAAGISEYEKSDCHLRIKSALFFKDLKFISALL
ncbi:MAG TPA: hypothetical protein PK712_05295 [Rectinema sp.]|nr:hypothetical protein [Rectinema sp.]